MVGVASDLTKLKDRSTSRSEDVNDGSSACM